MTKGCVTAVTITALCLLLSISVPAGTIWEKEHQIDRWTKAELKRSGGNTEAIRHVYSRAYKKWDGALNKAYKGLMDRLPTKEDKELLRESQRKWIAYRDAEFRFLPRHFQRDGGTLSLVMTDERMVHFIRERVIELEAYIHLLGFAP